MLVDADNRRRLQSITGKAANFRRARLVSDAVWPSPNKLIAENPTGNETDNVLPASVPGLPCLPRFAVPPIWGTTLRRLAG